ncbi:hypothetical protein [Sphingomonas abietis]|uniref:Uncharacterized protein n=1 Tax=Sphingomonas abietis TaxID=3012344 RepID=A0ABY7NSD0_9SPHN|nr:hypothetical protein [Sphingomonas abietis]WBO24077.1 hypothetical protein PBT88_08190 [Sphingomonas abietis]
MRDNKAFASLSSGLLARKGQARPAMRPQGYGFGTGSAEDLGWNDMGHDVPPPAPRAVTPKLPSSLAGPPLAPASPVDTPVEPPVVVRQQEEIAREFAAPAEPVLVEPVVATPPVEVTSVVAASVVDEAVAETSAPATPEPKTKTKTTKPAGKTVVTNKVAPKAVARRSEGRKAAFTLRLDADRHLRLRLACAVQNRSAQLLVIAALDQLLESLPDVARLADSLPAQN